MMVIDASAAVDLLMGTPKGRQVASRIAKEILHAPAILDLEVAQALRRWERSSQIDRTQAADAIENLLQLPLIRHAHDPLLRHIWSLHHNFTAYDAAYLALSAALGCIFLTCDTRLASARRQGFSVEVL